MIPNVHENFLYNLNTRECKKPAKNIMPAFLN